jgi:hypothetical protein
MALANFTAQLSTKNREKLGPLFDSNGEFEKDGDLFVEQMMKTVESGARTRISRPIRKLFNSIRTFREISSVVTSPYSAALWGSMRLIIQVRVTVSRDDIPLNMIIKTASESSYSLEELAEMLEELAETMRACEREYDLYPSPMATQLLAKLYSEFLEFCSQAIQTIQSTSVARIATANVARSRFQASITRIRKISSSVTREVEFQHRLELRNAHQRLINMERAQQSMIVAMQDQEKILTSLAEERRLVTMMKDQQVILQTVQQLQMRLLGPKREFDAQNDVEAEPVASLNQEPEGTTQKKTPNSPACFHP